MELKVNDDWFRLHGWHLDEFTGIPVDIGSYRGMESSRDVKEWTKWFNEAFIRVTYFKTTRTSTKTGEVVEVKELNSIYATGNGFHIDRNYSGNEITIQMLELITGLVCDYAK